MSAATGPRQAGPGFRARWRDRAAATSNLAVGMGPSPERLAWWGLPDTLRAAEQQSREIVETVAPEVGLLKIQTPFFERFGGRGIDLLRQIVDLAHTGGALVALDAKRCDAPDAMEALPQLYLGPDSVLGGDAVTLVPYMGMDALEPVLLAAGELGAGVLLMVRTSNHASGTVQHAAAGTARTVSQSVANAIGAWNRAHGTDHVGGVVGAPPEEARDLVARMGPGLVSLPGLGRPGRTVADVLAAAGDQFERAAFPVTSGLLRGGGGTALRESLRRWTDAVRGMVGAPR